jgi:uncharacterized membrane protein
MEVMTKSEFILKLYNKLKNFPEIEVNDRISFYSEIIDDKIEEGLSEEAAVAETGSVDDIAAQIIDDIPDSPEKEKIKKDVSAWQIVLLIVGSPVWFPILISIFAVVWSIVITFWAIEIPLYILAFISKCFLKVCIACAKFSAYITKKCFVGVARLFQG